MLRLCNGIIPNFRYGRLSATERLPRKRSAGPEKVHFIPEILR
jgi:hypothetical protein